MILAASCCAGRNHRHVPPPVETFDARPSRRDPTGTSALRAKFGADSDRRWAKLRVMVVEALTKKDLLGLGPATYETMSHAVDRVGGFQAWMNAALFRLILSDRHWITGRVHEAIESGHSRIAKIVPGASASPRDRSQHLATLAAAEMRGVCEAVSQQAARAVAKGLLEHARPAAIARAVAEVINKVGKRRGRAVTEYSVTLSHAKASLDALRARGIKRVGIDPEHVRSGLGDASVGWRASPSKKASNIFAVPESKQKKPPSSRAQSKIEKAQEVLERLTEVEVLTAGDEQVCEECQDISEEGPYDIDTAESLIPAHNECRCAFVPADDARFANVRE